MSDAANQAVGIGPSIFMRGTSFQTWNQNK
jgi:hypothetical protein